MPELPEVETVCRGLAKALTGARLIKVDVHRPDLRLPLPKNMEQRLKGRRVIDISRRAKYILINLDNSETILLHLGMSGRMVITPGTKRKTKAGKHDHIVFHFDRGLDVRFNDPRRFGVCDLVPTSSLPHHKLLRHLGVEPLGKDFTPAFLETRLKNKNTVIKAVLLDQHVVVGIGNIYASEILYDAGISPKRRAGTCSKEELEKLVFSVRKVLRAAIKAGGSSLRDYVQADGELGYFQHHFSVYDREGQPCSACTCNVADTGGVRRITQNGRSSFYCAVKQR